MGQGYCARLCCSEPKEYGPQAQPNASFHIVNNFSEKAGKDKIPGFIHMGRDHIGSFLLGTMT